MKTESNESLLGATVGPDLSRLAAPEGWSNQGHLLQTLMNQIPDAIYFKDANSRFVYINQAHARLFGLKDPAEALGKTDADYFTAAHAQQALADERQVIATGRPLVGIEEMETWPDGTVTWVSTTKMPLFDPSGKIVGTCGVSRDITKRKLAEQALAERTRQVLQQKQQMEEELKMARELQLAMLPQTFPKLQRGGRDGALEFFSFYFPFGAVSGDFFDVVELSDSKVGVFICDVMGHDVRAALITAMMRALVQDLSTASTDPGHLLAQINHGLSEVFKQTGTTMYATAFYLVADIERGQMSYSSAAHPAPLHLRRSNGNVERLVADLDGRKGPALGLFNEADFPSRSRSLSEGDLVALYTDGLIEAESPRHEHFSETGLVEAVRRRAHLPGGQLLSELISEIQNFSGQADFTDDVCLVGMEIKRLGT
jgi:sigma-B regulation protein RsbU (phosphoserine phosphatase)